MRLRRRLGIRVHHLDLITHALARDLIVGGARVVLPIVALSLDDAPRAGSLADVVAGFRLILDRLLLDPDAASRPTLLASLLLLIVLVVVVVRVGVTSLRLESVGVVGVG